MYSSSVLTLDNEQVFFFIEKVDFTLFLNKLNHEREIKKTYQNLIIKMENGSCDRRGMGFYLVLLEERSKF